MKVKHLKILIYLLLANLFFLSSCITPKDTNLLQDIKKDYSTVPPPGEYRVIPGDVLRIVVYIYDDNESKALFNGFLPRAVGAEINPGHTGGGYVSSDTDNAIPIPVYADGTLNFPYVGRVFVEGLTLLEIRELLSSRIKEISKTAAVNVSLYNDYFSIIGESGASRIKMRSNSMTIYQALSIANSISSYSALNRVSIIRQTKDGTRVMTFDLRTDEIVNTEYYYIQPNDVVYFPQKSSRFFGATNSFGAFFGLIVSFITIFVGVLDIF